jgi:hypothetical protein
MMKQVDELVTEAVLRAVDKGALTRVLRQRDDGRILDDLVGVETQLAELARMWADRQLTRVEWEAARESLSQRREQLMRQADDHWRREGLDNVDSELRQAWPALPLHKRRAVIKAVVEQVIIHPAARRGQRFDPARVEIRWRA